MMNFDSLVIGNNIEAAWKVLNLMQEERDVALVLKKNWPRHRLDDLIHDHELLRLYTMAYQSDSLDYYRDMLNFFHPHYLHLSLGETNLDFSFSPDLRVFELMRKIGFPSRIKAILEKVKNNSNFDHRKLKHSYRPQSFYEQFKDGLQVTHLLDQHQDFFLSKKLSKDSSHEAILASTLFLQEILDGFHSLKEKSSKDFLARFLFSLQYFYCSSYDHKPSIEKIQNLMINLLRPTYRIDLKAFAKSSLLGTQIKDKVVPGFFVKGLSANVIQLDGIHSLVKAGDFHFVDNPHIKDETKSGLSTERFESFCVFFRVFGLKFFKNLLHRSFVFCHESHFYGSIVLFDVEVISSRFLKVQCIIRDYKKNNKDKYLQELESLVLEHFIQSYAYGNVSIKRYTEIEHPAFYKLN